MQSIAKRLTRILETRTPRWGFYRAIEGHLFNSRGTSWLSLRKWNRSS